MSKKIKLTESQFQNILDEARRTLVNEQKNQLVESVLLSENVIDKFKEILRSGLVTSAVVMSLLSAPGISAAEKGEIKNLATQNGIEVATNPQRTLNSQVVKVNGAGKSMDQEVAKKMAISNARNQGALKVSDMMGGKDFDISNFKIENVKFQKDPSGNYFCAVQCSMIVTPSNNIATNENRVIKEDVGYSNGIDLSFVEEIVNKFRQLQEAYNEFVISNNPFADFSQIEDAVKELVHEFSSKIQPAISIISDLSQEDYDSNDEYYTNVEQQIHNLKNKVETFEYEIEKAATAYAGFSGIQQKLSYF